MKNRLKIFKNSVLENSIKIGNYRLKAFVIGLFVYLFICLFPPLAGASNSSNSDYNIDVNNIDFNPHTITPTPKPYQPSETEPDDNPPEIYVDNSSLVFSTDNNFIDFGLLSPANPVTRTVKLVIANHQTAYSLLAFEDHPLSQSIQQKEPQGNTAIPDTTCDDGQCSETNESQWTSNLTYGFGYRCDNLSGSACLGFPNDNDYRQFSDSLKHEQPETIMETGDKYEQDKAQITLKLNLAGTQNPGSYNNSVTFIAVPNF